MSQKELADDEIKPKTLVKMPYVFGSSTPREFSYLDHIPAKYRIYNCKLRSSRRAREEPSLRDFMNEIRNPSPTRRLRDRSVDSARIFVFGSSTPRDLSYLERVPPDLRIYDVKLGNLSNDKRSKTTSFTGTGTNASAEGGRQSMRRSSSMSSALGGSTTKVERISASSTTSSLPTKRRAFVWNENSSSSTKSKARNDRTRSVPASVRQHVSQSIDTQNKQRTSPPSKDADGKANEGDKKSSTNNEIKRNARPENKKRMGFPKKDNSPPVKTKTENGKEKGRTITQVAKVVTETVVTNIKDVLADHKSVMNSAEVIPAVMDYQLEKEENVKEASLRELESHLDFEPSSDVLRSAATENYSQFDQPPEPDEITAVSAKEEENVPNRKFSQEAVTNENAEDNKDVLQEDFDVDIQRGRELESSDSAEGKSVHQTFAEHVNDEKHSDVIERETDKEARRYQDELEEDRNNSREEQHEEIEEDNEVTDETQFDEKYQHDFETEEEVSTQQELDTSTDQRQLPSDEHEDNNMDNDVMDDGQVIERGEMKNNEEENGEIQITEELEPEGEIIEPYGLVEDRPSSSAGEQLADFSDPGIQAESHNNSDNYSHDESNLEPYDHNENLRSQTEITSGIHKTIDVRNVETSEHDSDGNLGQMGHDLSDAENETDGSKGGVSSPVMMDTEEDNHLADDDDVESHIIESHEVDTVDNNDGLQGNGDSSPQDLRSFLNETLSDTAETILPFENSALIIKDQTEVENTSESGSNETREPNDGTEHKVEEINTVEEPVYNPDLKNMILSAFDCQNANATLADVYQFNDIEDRSDVKKLIDNAGSFRPELYSQLSEEDKQMPHRLTGVEGLKTLTAPSLIVQTPHGSSAAAEVFEIPSVKLDEMTMQAVHEEITSDKSSEDKIDTEGSSIDEKGFETDDEREVGSKYKGKRPITPPHDECRFVEDVGLDNMTVSQNQTIEVSSSDKHGEIHDGESDNQKHQIFNLDELDNIPQIHGVSDSTLMINNIIVNAALQDFEKSLSPIDTDSRNASDTGKFFGVEEASPGNADDEHYDTHLQDHYLYDQKENVLLVMEKIHLGLDEKDFTTSENNSDIRSSLADKIETVADNFVQHVFSSDEQSRTVAEIMEGIEKTSPRHTVDEELETVAIFQNPLAVDTDVKVESDLSINLSEISMDTETKEQDETESTSESFEKSESIESPDTCRHLPDDTLSLGNPVQQCQTDHDYRESKVYMNLQSHADDTNQNYLLNPESENLLRKSEKIAMSNSSSSSLSSDEDKREVAERNRRGSGNANEHSVGFYQNYKGQFQHLPQLHDSDNEV